MKPAARTADPGQPCPEIFGPNEFPLPGDEPHTYPMPGGGRSVLPKRLAERRYGMWNRQTGSRVSGKERNR